MSLFLTLEPGREIRIGNYLTLKGVCRPGSDEMTPVIIDARHGIEICLRAKGRTADNRKPKTFGLAIDAPVEVMVSRDNAKIDPADASRALAERIAKEDHRQALLENLGARPKAKPASKAIQPPNVAPEAPQAPSGPVEYFSSDDLEN